MIRIRMGLAVAAVILLFTGCTILDMLGIGETDLAFFWLRTNIEFPVFDDIVEQGTRIYDGDEIDLGDLDLYSLEAHEDREDALGRFYLVNMANLQPTDDIIVTITGEPVRSLYNEVNSRNGVFFYANDVDRVDDYTQSGYAEARLDPQSRFLGRNGDVEIPIMLSDPLSIAVPQGERSAEVSLSEGLDPIVTFTLTLNNVSASGAIVVDVDDVEPGSDVEMFLQYVDFPGYTGPEIEDFGRRSDTADADGHSEFVATAYRDIYDTNVQGIPASTSLLYVVADENNNDTLETGEPVYLSVFDHQPDTHIVLNETEWGDRVNPTVTLASAFAGHDGEALKVYFVPVGVTAEQAEEEGVDALGATFGPFAFMGYYSGFFTGDTQSPLLTVATVTGTTLYDIIAYIDADADSEVDPGEPYLTLSGVDIGATAAIELNPSSFSGYTGTTRPLPSF